MIVLTRSFFNAMFKLKSSATLFPARKKKKKKRHRVEICDMLKLEIYFSPLTIKTKFQA